MIAVTCHIVFGILGVAVVLTIVRIFRGPGLADRVVGLDLITAIATAAIINFAVLTRHAVYLDVAIAVALVSFLGTLAFAQYLLRRAGLE